MIHVGFSKGRSVDIPLLHTIVAAQTVSWGYVAAYLDGEGSYHLKMLERKIC